MRTRAANGRSGQGTRRRKTQANSGLTPQTPDPRGAAFQVRRGAARVVRAVTDQRQLFDAAFADALGHDLEGLDARDTAFARLIAVTVLRRLSQIDAALASVMDKPLDDRAPFARAIMRVATAELVFLDIAPHAAIDTAVRVMKAHGRSRHFGGLANAVLRKLSSTRDDLRNQFARDGAMDDGHWLAQRWTRHWGADRAAKIALAHTREPALDLTLAKPQAPLPEGLDGVALSTGTFRAQHSGRIESLPGYADGAWWVQDAAAALPARLLNVSKGERVLDVCAAPGGKTAQLISAGAHVTALDISKTRMKRVRQNLTRLDLKAELVTADIFAWTPDVPFDAVLLDAPCSATGTIRRHPDIPLLKDESDIAELVVQQKAMLRRVAEFVRPGGRLIYCVCSLELDEGETRVADFLAENSAFRLAPIAAETHDVPAEMVTHDGMLRTFPFLEVPHLAGDGTSPGIDGFFAALLVRSDPSVTGG
ncbi:MAG: transcription antitermination factor NusB [Pseudomonadota bacterium]